VEEGARFRRGFHDNKSDERAKRLLIVMQKKWLRLRIYSIGVTWRPVDWINQILTPSIPRRLKIHTPDYPISNSLSPAALLPVPAEDLFCSLTVSCVMPAMHDDGLIRTFSKSACKRIWMLSDYYANLKSTFCSGCIG
jgi:hypothetical protein